MDGTVLDVVPLATTPNYTLYGADITAFAGTTVDLRFTALLGGSLYLDDIRFSSQLVPEPGMLALLSLGGIMFAVAFRMCPRGRHFF